jgi:hypothetical protein
MKRLLLLIVLLSAQSVYCHKLPITFSTRSIHDPLTKVLDIDIEQFKDVIVPRGTYRLATKAGVTNKYVTLALDSKISKFYPGFICFYYKNYDNSYDRIACLDVKK